MKGADTVAQATEPPSPPNVNNLRRLAFTNDINPDAIRELMTALPFEPFGKGKFWQHPRTLRRLLLIVYGPLIAVWAAIAGMEVHRRLSKNLQRMRREKGLSQEELADKAHIHQTYLSGLETGKRNPSIAVLSRVADALEVDVSELLSPV